MPTIKNGRRLSGKRAAERAKKEEQLRKRPWTRAERKNRERYLASFKKRMAELVGPES